MGRLLQQAKAAEGALQVQQAQVQAQGVLGHQLLAIEQQLATQARERSEKPWKPRAGRRWSSISWINPWPRWKEPTCRKADSSPCPAQEESKWRV